MDDTKRPSQQSQSERFKEAARQTETDDDPEAFERVFGKIVPPVVPAADSEKERQDRSVDRSGSA